MKINSNFNGNNNIYNDKLAFKHRLVFSKFTNFQPTVFNTVDKVEMPVDLLLLEKDDFDLVKQLNTTDEWLKNSSFTKSICNCFFDIFFNNLFEKSSVRTLFLAKQENKYQVESLFNRILGIMSLEDRKDDYRRHLHLSFMQTKPEYIKTLNEESPQILGIGTAMFKSAVALAKKYGYDKLTFGTTVKSDAFYHKLGITTSNYQGSVNIEKSVY